MTPVDVDLYEKLLFSANYDYKKSSFLVNSFRNGFPLHYMGKEDVQMVSANLRFHIGDEVQLWNKVMKEVKLKRYAGPFDKIPFDHYIQSPIGLVPKDGGSATRLIFHLSHPRHSGFSVNANIPPSHCSTKYPDFNEAVQMCLQEGGHVV